MHVAWELRQDLRPWCDCLLSVPLSHALHASLCQKFLLMLNCPVPYTLSSPDSEGTGLALPVIITPLLWCPFPLLSPLPCKDQIGAITLNRVISARNGILAVANTL